jgi:hypothetical protein
MDGERHGPGVYYDALGNSEAMNFRVGRRLSWAVYGDRPQTAITNLCSYAIDSGEITAESWTNLQRPPKTPTEESGYLLEKARATGSLMGQELGG